MGSEIQKLKHFICGYMAANLKNPRNPSFKKQHGVRLDGITREMITVKV